MKKEIKPEKLMTEKEVQSYIDNYLLDHKPKVELDLIRMQALNYEALSAKEIAESKKIAAQIEINKVEELRLLLQAHIVDQEKTLIGSEPSYRPMIMGSARNIIAKKMIDIIERF